MNDTPTPRPRGAVPVRWPLFAVVFAVTLVVGLAGLGAPPAGEPTFHGTPYPDAEPAPAFTLTDHHGRVAGLEDFRGEAVLLFFGFTHCPDVCPLTLSRLGTVLEGMGRSAGKVNVLLVTVDPARDTPEVLAAYVRRFGPRVTGLTGDPEALEAMRREYGAYTAMRDRGSEPPMVMHTDAVFGIDRDGRLRVLLHADEAEDRLRSDIRILLRL